MTVVKGDLNAVGVPRLFRVLADEKRTGLLNCVRTGLDGEERAQVFFRDGDVYSTHLRGTGTKLGSRLISAGHASNDDIDAALQIQGKEGGARRLGRILVDEGYVEVDELHAIVRQQMEDTVFELLRWEDGSFEFVAGESTEEDVVLEVSVENLIMEGARRFREWHHMTRRVPSLDSIPKFSPTGDAAEVALTPEEWSLVSRVDGETTITDLGVLCGFTDLEAARTVLGLMTTGVLELIFPEGVAPAHHEDGMDEMFDELERALQEAASRGEESSSMSLQELVGTSDDQTEVDEEDETEASTEEPVEAVAEEPVVEEPEPVEAVAEEPEAVEAVEAVAEEPVAEEPVEAVVEEPVEAVAEAAVAEESEPVEAVAEEPVAEEPEPVEAIAEEAVEAAAEEAVEAVAEAEEAQAPQPEAVKQPTFVAEGVPTEPAHDETLALDELSAVSAQHEATDPEAQGSEAQAPAPIEAEVASEDKAEALEPRAVRQPTFEGVDQRAGQATEDELVDGLSEAGMTQKDLEEASSHPPAPQDVPAVTESESGDSSAHLVAHEGGGNGAGKNHSYSSLAREFADLSTPLDDPRVTQSTPTPDPDEDDEADEEAPAPKKTERKRPTPGVDVSSLIREFSSLGEGDKGDG